MQHNPVHDPAHNVAPEGPEAILAFLGKPLLPPTSPDVVDDTDQIETDTTPEPTVNHMAVPPDAPAPKVVPITRSAPDVEDDTPTSDLSYSEGLKQLKIDFTAEMNSRFIQYTEGGVIYPIIEDLRTGRRAEKSTLLITFKQYCQRRPDYRQYHPAERNAVVDYVLQEGLTSYVYKSWVPNITGDRYVITDGGFRDYNSYRAYTPTVTQASCAAPFTDFMERLFPISEERHIVTQWLAHMIQKPEERPSWHILLTSLPGTGKGVLAEQILGPLLSNQWKKYDNFKQLTDRFSTAFDDNMFVLLDDIVVKPGADMDSLKSKLSDEYQRVERKGLDAIQVRAYTRFILASNKVRPIRLDDTDRRWYAPSYMNHKTGTGQVAREETQSFIRNTLLPWLDHQNGLDAVYHYLMDYSLSGFDAKRVPIHTATMSDMVDASKSTLDQEIEDFIATSGKLVFSMTDLGVTLSEVPKSDLVSSKLVDLGWKKGKLKVKRSDGLSKRMMVWYHKSWKASQVVAYTDKNPVLVT